MKLERTVTERTEHCKAFDTPMGNATRIQQVFLNLCAIIGQCQNNLMPISEFPSIRRKLRNFYTLDVKIETNLSVKMYRILPCYERGKSVC